MSRKGVCCVGCERQILYCMYCTFMYCTFSVYCNLYAYDTPFLVCTLKAVWNSQFLWVYNAYSPSKVKNNKQTKANLIYSLVVREQYMWWSKCGRSSTLSHTVLDSCWHFLPISPTLDYPTHTYTQLFPDRSISPLSPALSWQARPLPKLSCDFPLKVHLSRLLFCT